MFIYDSQRLQSYKSIVFQYAQVFLALECILLRISGDLGILRSVGENIVRKMLQNHTGCVYHMLRLHNKASGYALRLLTAMVALGQKVARDIVLQLDFTNPAWMPLFSRTDLKVGIIFDQPQK